MGNLLEFELFSGGKVTIDLGMCANCKSKACVGICNAPKMGGILELKEEKPFLKISLEEAKRGGCIECLGCELNCQLYGKKAIRITLATPELDALLKSFEG